MSVQLLSSDEVLGTSTASGVFVSPFRSFRSQQAGFRVVLPTRFVRSTFDDVFAQRIGVFVQFVAIRTDVGFGWDVRDAFGRVFGVESLLPADGMSFDHVHLVERLRRESFRAQITFVLQFDKVIHVLMSLLEMALEDDLVAEVNFASRTRKRLGLDVLFLDVVLERAECRELPIAFRTFRLVVVFVRRPSV